MNEHYTINLESTVLDVRYYPVDMIKADLKLLGLKSPLELDLVDNFNTKVFKTEAQAEKWLQKYTSIKKHLAKNAKARKDLPKMLCKNRYIILSALGEKLYTRRSYKKNWEVGQDFQLYDQTVFLTVRLVEIEDTKDGYFTYHYELV